MMKERERRVLDIEADILDVNEIMRDLLPLVHQQGEAIGTFEWPKSKYFHYAKFALKTKKNHICFLLISQIPLRVALIIQLLTLNLDEQN